MKKKILVVIFILFTISVGFLRDYIFISINEKTGQGPSGSGGLFIWKWSLTFAFALSYLGITILFLHVLFSQKTYIYLALFVYALLFFVSFIAASSGFIFTSFEKVYPFVRTVMGIAQSPIILMILVPACTLNQFFLADKKNI